MKLSNVLLLAAIVASSACVALPEDPPAGVGLPPVGSAKQAVSSEVKLIDDFSVGPVYEVLTAAGTQATQYDAHLWGGFRTTVFLPSRGLPAGTWGNLYIGGSASQAIFTGTTSGAVDGVARNEYGTLGTTPPLPDLTGDQLTVTFQYNAQDVSLCWLVYAATGDAGNLSASACTHVNHGTVGPVSILFGDLVGEAKNHPAQIERMLVWVEGYGNPIPGYSFGISRIAITSGS